MLNNNLGSCFALAVYKKKLLLLLRDIDDTNPNEWGLPGGGTDIGETSEETLKRELQEEASITAKNYVFLFNRPSVGIINKTVDIYYVPLTEANIASMKLGDEGQKLEFFALDEVANLDLVPSLKKYLPKYKAALEKFLN
jgi:8-oxo-dGTP pyrophosphatase MutT (NUDIX family)